MIKYSIALMILFISSFCYAESKRKIAVLNFSSNLSEEKELFFRKALEIELEKNNFNIETLSAKNLYIDFSKTNSPKDQTFLAGAKLNADYIIYGTINKFINYTVEFEVIDIKNRDIVFNDKKTFNSNSNINNMAYVVALTITKRIKYNKSSFYPYNIKTGASYFIPSREFYNLFDNGYGYYISAYCNIGMSNIIAGIEGHYYKLSGDKEITDEAVSIPISLYVGYSLYFWRFTFTPTLHYGRDYLSLKYYTNSEKTQYEDVAHWNNLFKFGLELGLVIYDPIKLNIGYQKGFIYYNKRQSFSSYYICLNYGFW